MAVLTLGGAEAVLAAQAASLPQPDQLCGPFSARAALHAVLDPGDIPDLAALAIASGTTVWPHDVAATRPPGVPVDRAGWEHLARSSDAESSGTDAAGLARGIAATTGGAAAVVPVAGTGADAASLEDLLVGLASFERPVGVVANVRTGALDPGTGWDVGHFVVLWAVATAEPRAARVAVADTYPELGAPGERPGCRWVPVARLAAAIGAPPGRGLLVVVPASEADAVADRVRRAGLDQRIWAT